MLDQRRFGEAPGKHERQFRPRRARCGPRPRQEAVLNHISGSRAGIAGVYQRHDWAAEKRAALDAWGGHVLAVAEGRSASSNVVTLGRAG
jgi:hypothetical protein